MTSIPEDVTAWLQSRIPSEQSAQLREPMEPLRSSRRTSQLTHKPLSLPITIDGNRIDDPGAIRRFTGQALHTVLDQDALDGKEVRILTDRDEAEQYAKSLSFPEVEVPGAPERGLRNEAPSKESDPPGESTPPPIAGAQVPGGVPPDGGYIDLYQHVDWGGCCWRLLEWQHKAVGDFRQWGACGFLWWGWINANDQVSSTDCMISGTNPWVILAEHINLAGSWLWLPGRSLVQSLVPFGWNDRASSLIILYF